MFESASPLSPCDSEIFAEGRPVMLVDTNVGSVNFESWVRKLAEQSGAPVDWHYSGGIAQVLTLGDVRAVRERAKALWAEAPPEPGEDGPMSVYGWCEDGRGLYRRGRLSL